MSERIHLNQHNANGTPCDCFAPTPPEPAKFQPAPPPSYLEARGCLPSQVKAEVAIRRGRGESPAMKYPENERLRNENRQLRELLKNCQSLLQGVASRWCNTDGGASGKECEQPDDFASPFPEGNVHEGYVIPTYCAEHAPEGSIRWR